MYINSININSVNKYTFIHSFIRIATSVVIMRPLTRDLTTDKNEWLVPVEDVASGQHGVSGTDRSLDWRTRPSATATGNRPSRHRTRITDGRFLGRRTIAARRRRGGGGGTAREINDTT